MVYTLSILVSCYRTFKYPVDREYMWLAIEQFPEFRGLVCRSACQRYACIYTPFNYTHGRGPLSISIAFTAAGSVISFSLIAANFARTQRGQIRHDTPTAAPFSTPLEIHS